MIAIAFHFYSILLSSPYNLQDSGRRSQISQEADLISSEESFDSNDSFDITSPTPPSPPPRPPPDQPEEGGMHVEGESF